MAKSVFAVKADLALFRRQAKKALEAVKVGVAEGTALSLDKTVGRIKRRQVGPRVWRKSSYKGLSGKDRGIAFAMAINIAKKEGFRTESGDFIHGLTFTHTRDVWARAGRSGGRVRIGQRTRRTTLGQGAGWKRVLELVPRMAPFRPPGKQKIWIQTGALRKSLDYSVYSKFLKGKERRVSGGAGKSILRGNIAAGMVSTPHKYAIELEEKYDFAFEEIRYTVNSRELERNINKSVKRNIDLLSSRNRRKGK